MGFLVPKLQPGVGSRGSRSVRCPVGGMEDFSFSLQISRAFSKRSVRGRTVVFLNFVCIGAEGDGSDLPPLLRVFF